MGICYFLDARIEKAMDKMASERIVLKGGIAGGDMATLRNLEISLNERIIICFRPYRA